MFLNQVLDRPANEKPFLLPLTMRWCPTSARSRLAKS